MDDATAGLLSLDGKVAVVTGAATGIGAGIASVLSAAGARVVVADVDAEGAELVAGKLAGGLAVEVDVTDADACERAVERVVADAGRVDVLVNNAGTYQESGSILDQSDESWQRAVDVNFHSVFRMTRPVARRLVDQGDGGAVVNISSVDGTLPCLGTGYDAAKAAVDHFTRSLAVDLAPHGVRVNAVAPGHIPTETLRRMAVGELPPVWTPGSTTGLMGPMMRQRSANIPLGRSGTPDEIGRAVLFLCSEASSYVTGQVLTVDGGWTLV